ncbi:large ribosomal subunit protein uL2m isoform X2 [Chrysemys picta bellii]
MAVSSLTRALGALLLSSAPSLPQRAQAPRLVCLGGNLLPPCHGFSTSSTLSTNDPMWKCRIKYTTRPIGMKKTGGRDHTGRIAVHGIGGGHKQRYRMIDFQRLRYVPGAESGPYEEKVIQVRYDPCRSADIALVAGGKQKRWIIATENMQPGDLLKTSGHIGRMAVSANEGDAYPLGALPVGTLINNLESHPGKGAQYIRAAGTCGCWSEVTGGGVLSPGEVGICRCWSEVAGLRCPVPERQGPAGAGLRWLAWGAQSRRGRDLRVLVCGGWLGVPSPGEAGTCGCWSEVAGLGCPVPERQGPVGAGLRWLAWGAQSRRGRYLWVLV